jgi:hypothetical protein
VGTLQCLVTIGLVVQIQHPVLNVFKPLVPIGLRLDVHGPDACVSLSAQIGDQMATDETAAPANYNNVILHLLKDSIRCSGDAVCAGSEQDGSLPPVGTHAPGHRPKLAPMGGPQDTFSQP